ncbi:MAG: thiol-activated cytolysin family protein [Trueperaceae bacterium]
MKAIKKLIFLLSISVLLVLAACSQTKPQAIDPTVRECDYYLKQQVADKNSNIIDSCEPNPGDDDGDPIDPPTPSASESLELAPWEELTARAEELGVSLGEAASPGVDEYIGQTNDPNTILLQPTDYPRNATDTQDFINKLFRDSPLTLTGPLPDPSQNPDDPCKTTLVDGSSLDNQSSSILMAIEDYSGVVWPGALHQGRTVPGGAGSLADIPVGMDKRNALDVVSDSAFIRRTGVAPTSGAVYTAIGDIIQESQNTWRADPSKIYFKVVQASSLREVSVKTGFSASAFGLDLTRTMDASTSSSSNNVYVVFYQTMFNVYLDTRGYRPLQALFNNNLVVTDLNDFGDREELGYENLPTYIHSVSYGRMLIARYSSSKDINELSASLEAKFKKGDIGGSNSMSAHYKRIIDNSEIEVVAVGGPYDIQKEALKTDGWKDYFKRSDVPLNTLKPISYVVKRWDGQTAKVSNTFKYLKRECPAVPAKIEVEIANEKGDTSLYLTQPGKSEVEILKVGDDGSKKIYDITSFLSGDITDDNIRVRSWINKYGVFGTSRRDTKVTFIVDGIPTDQIAQGSCKTCNSADLDNFAVNKRNGKVERR